ncbi:MAG: UDP-N-acetylmuramate dehydrogenase [Bacteroidota bacterium]
MNWTTQDLTPFNTFGLTAQAEQYAALKSIDQLLDWAPSQAPDLVLGGGSNLLLMSQISGKTLHVLLGGVQVMRETGHRTEVRVGAGINWHQFVLYALENGWYGLENLALIPGTVGAAPVQNIGAYGLEVCERIVRVHAYEYGKGQLELSANDCQFAYRDSLFKREPGRFLITAVDFELGDDFPIRTHYGAIQDRLTQNGIKHPTPPDVARAVIEIRNQKLPDWSLMGNSGSFFKNPMVSADFARSLSDQYVDMPQYPVDGGQIKLAAGWLIDQCGFKGKRQGAVGCYKNQALVIVNHGGATSEEVLAFSQDVQQAVEAKFGVELEREVRLIR